MVEDTSGRADFFSRHEDDRPEGGGVRDVIRWGDEVAMGTVRLHSSNAVMTAPMTNASPSFPNHDARRPCGTAVVSAVERNGIGACPPPSTEERYKAGLCGPVEDEHGVEVEETAYDASQCHGRTTSVCETRLWRGSFFSSSPFLFFFFFGGGGPSYHTFCAGDTGSERSEDVESRPFSTADGGFFHGKGDGSFPMTRAPGIFLSFPSFRVVCNSGLASFCRFFFPFPSPSPAVVEASMGEDISEDCCESDGWCREEC